jgi:F-type H+-transporting ATPase subunit a
VLGTFAPALHGVRGVATVACEKGDPGYCAPAVGSFLYKPLVHFKIAGQKFEITKLTLLLYFAIIVICGLFVWATRNPKIVPGKGQWLAEETYGFVRNGIAIDVIGPEEGARFAPYLTSLFMFILALNLFEIVPIAQVPVTGRISIPAALAGISWIMFNYLGIKRHGLGGYFKTVCLPPNVPWWIYPILIPIEFVSTIIIRPFTLAVRLFANMFAGHLLLLVFITGATYLFGVGGFSYFFGGVSFVMSILITFFELLVDALQAYIFTILTAIYVSGALAEEH